MAFFDEKSFRLKNVFYKKNNYHENNQIISA